MQMSQQQQQQQAQALTVGSWMNSTSVEEQTEHFGSFGFYTSFPFTHLFRSGHPLTHFRNQRDVVHNRIGGRSQRSMYTVAGFTFTNMQESRATLSATLAETVNDFVRSTVLALSEEERARRITMVFHHEALREANKSLFVNLNATVDPGKAVISFFDRFAQSNKAFRMDQEMSFDFWIS